MRIWVTRDEPSDGPLSTALRAAGLTVVHEPVLMRRVVDECGSVIAKLGPRDWLILTSPYAVKAVNPVPMDGPNVAVVGESSRQAALARGMRVELVSERGDAGSLFAELRKKVAGGTVCYPRSSLAKARESWPGVELLSPILYETRPRAFDRKVVERVDLITLTSPSAVEAIRSSGIMLRERPCATIGPTTSAALRSLGIEPVLEAPQRSLESLAEAISDYTQSSRHQRA